MGYELCSPFFLTAAAVGASHKRERVFVMAYLPGKRFRETRRHWQRSTERTFRGGELAVTTGRGFGELRQSPVVDGQSDGRHVEMGNTPSEVKRSIAGTSDARSSPGLESRGEQLADAKHGTGGTEPKQQQGKRRNKSGKSGRETMEDSRSEQIYGNDAGGFQRVTGGTNGSMVEQSGEVGQADFGCERQQGQRKAWSAPGPIGRGDRTDIFAPGPKSQRWPAIIANDPHLAPAIEPGLCVLVDGCSVVADESRADQLRCGGNGVVPLCAALAFSILLDRIDKE
jgi:site-specific DNA-cytosine methylase